MKKLILSASCLSFAILIVGCGTDNSNQSGAVNKGTGETEDPDAGVGTDPELMDPNYDKQK